MTDGALREELIAQTSDALQLGPSIVDRVVRAAPAPPQAYHGAPGAPSFGGRGGGQGFQGRGGGQGFQGRAAGGQDVRRSGAPQGGGDPGQWGGDPGGYDDDPGRFGGTPSGGGQGGRGGVIVP